MADFWPENAKNGPKTAFRTIFSRLACGNFLIICIMIENHDILKMMLKVFHWIFNLAHNGGFFGPKILKMACKEGLLPFSLDWFVETF